MKVIIGLGNPGYRFKNTRHNSGVMLVDKLVTQLALDSHLMVTKGVEIFKNDEIMLVKSVDYFMNESGKIIEALDNRQWALDALYVVHDDLDLKLGEYKIQFGKGPEVHGGINDIERVIGKDFWRIRIGIDNRGTPRTPGEEYVLQKFGEEELEVLGLVLSKIVEELK